MTLTAIDKRLTLFSEYLRYRTNFVPKTRIELPMKKENGTWDYKYGAGTFDQWLENNGYGELVV